jgi:ubiquinone/menaquinone biosynthesis C-methylase UbiE
VEGEQRTRAQLREHYEIEKELARKLRNASRQERRHLYTSLYNELFKRVPLHPQLSRKASPEGTAAAVLQKIKFLNRFLNEGITFLEVGPGDCVLSLEVSNYVKQVYAVDVSYEITKGLMPPQNFQLILSDGCSISVPQNSVDVVYSNQLMEHLHPDDAFAQLRNIYRVLICGGVYICITPHRFSGPHDISKHFDTVATGFHLQEYTLSELSKLFKKVGFSTVEVYVGAKGKYARAPLFLPLLFETLLGTLPYAFRVRIARNLLFSLFLGIRLVATK